MMLRLEKIPLRPIVTPEHSFFPEIDLGYKDLVVSHDTGAFTIVPFRETPWGLSLGREVLLGIRRLCKQMDIDFFKVRRDIELHHLSLDDPLEKSWIDDVVATALDLSPTNRVPRGVPANPQINTEKLLFLFVINKKTGATGCEMSSKGFDFEPVYDLSLLHPNDKYSYKTGLKSSMGKCLKKVFSKNERTKVWKEVFERYPFLGSDNE